MRAWNRKKKPKHTTIGKPTQFENFIYIKHLQTKKISIEHYEADKYWIFRYNLEKVCKNGFTYDGNWFSSRELIEWQDIYDRYNKRV